MGPQVDHTFAVAGRYVVSVAATDARGAVGTGLVVITVAQPDYPNCFNPVSLVLENDVVEDSRIFEACTEIAVKPTFSIGSTGSATFRAGERVVLENGFAVSSGGTLEIWNESILGQP